MKKRWLVYLLVISTPALAQRLSYDTLKKIIAWQRHDSLEATSLAHLAWMLKNRGELDSAAEYARQSIDLSRNLNYKQGVADGFNKLGVIQSNMGNYPAALQNYLEALHLAEELKNEGFLPDVLINLGNLYFFQAQYEKALTYQKRALAINTATAARDRSKKHIVSLANTLCNVGIIYSGLRQPDTSLLYYQKALELFKEGGQKLGQANTINNIASWHEEKGDLPTALRYFKEAMSLYEEINDPGGVATVLINMAAVHTRLGNYSEAEGAGLKGLEITRSIGELDGVKESHLFLSRIYEQTGRHALALKHYKDHIAARDSLQNEENTKKTVRLEMQYEFEKKEAATRLEQEKKDAITSAEAKKQRIILMAISGFGLLVLGFAVFAYRSFLQKKKANVEISNQKQVIEEKQKEILDSIHYARRIQKSLMPTESNIEKILGRLQK